MTLCVLCHTMCLACGLPTYSTLRGVACIMPSPPLPPASQTPPPGRTRGGNMAPRCSHRPSHTSASPLCPSEKPTHPRFSMVFFADTRLLRVGSRFLSNTYCSNPVNRQNAASEGKWRGSYTAPFVLVPDQMVSARKLLSSFSVNLRIAVSYTCKGGFAR